MHNGLLDLDWSLIVHFFEPLVLKAVLSCDSIAWILGKHGGDEVFGFFRDACPVFVGERDFLLQDVLKDF